MQIIRNFVEFNVDGGAEFMKRVKDYFNKFYTEIGKYKQGVHVLNDGISETEVNDFEIKYHMYLPFFYREWLKMNNGASCIIQI